MAVTMAADWPLQVGAWTRVHLESGGERLTDKAWAAPAVVVYVNEAGDALLFCKHGTRPWQVRSSVAGSPGTKGETEFSEEGQVDFLRFVAACPDAFYFGMGLEDPEPEKV